MAAVTHRNTTGSTVNAESYASSSFTPAADELLVVFVVAGATTAAGSMTDSQGLGFTKVDHALFRTSLDRVYCFVANALAAASSMTVTFACTGDQANGALIFVAGVSGMTKTGSTAVRQSAKQDNQAASTTPAPAFAVACQTGNPTLGCVGNASGPAGLTPPTNWTERADTNYSTPTTGGEYVSRDSGFTGTTITWGSTSATAFGDLIVELDSSAAGVTLGQATETDSALPLSAAKSATFGQPSTSDVGLPLAAAKTVTAGQPAEADTAPPLSATKVAAFGQPSTSDVGLPLSVSKIVTLGQAVEIDTALPLAGGNSVVFGQAVEIDTARGLTVAKTVLLGQAAETDDALALSAVKAVTVGQAIETDTALPLTVIGGIPDPNPLRLQLDEAVWVVLDEHALAFAESARVAVVDEPALVLVEARHLALGEAP